MRSTLADYCPCNMCSKTRENNKKISDDTLYRDMEGVLDRFTQASWGRITVREFILMNGAED